MLRGQRWYGGGGGQVTLVSLWWSWVSMTHWAWDCLWAPPWGRASPTSAQTDTVSLSFVSGCLHLLCTLQAVASAAQASLLLCSRKNWTGKRPAGAEGAEPEHGGQLTW